MKTNIQFTEDERCYAVIALRSQDVFSCLCNMRETLRQFEKGNLVAAQAVTMLREDIADCLEGTEL